MVKRPHVRWTNHGHLCLCLQDVHPDADLTICMDTSSNPGPVNRTETFLDMNRTNNTSAILQTHNSVSNQSCSFHRVYSRRGLWDLKTIPTFNNQILDQIKQSGLFRFRGKRAGRRQILKQYEVNNKSYNIPVIMNRDRKSHYSPNHMHTRERNLIPISRTPTFDNHGINYPMPKCLLINICGLNKTKNRVRAPVALAADMIATDVDICIVSETHLKPDIPDSVVAISNYVLHRRDRNCFGNDKRKGGGEAVYVRSNIHIESVDRSDKYESISVVIKLPGDHKMLICGVYNPPKAKYQEIDLLNYLTEKMDDFLDTNPDGVVMCGGDFNNLKTENLTTNIGLDVIVDFPTRNNAILDKCLTNRADLFTKPYLLQTQTETDHLGIIVPPGTKLKPIRVKCTIRDRRTHRMIVLKNALQQQDWSKVLDSDDVNEAANILHTTINYLLDSCPPVRTQLKCLRGIQFG